jgi:clathrin heavy chain
MEHLKQHFSRINIPRVMRTCERNQQWAELTFLHVHYDEHDNAAQVMMAHSAEAWDHREFKEIMLKVANTDIVYKAIGFYLEEQPLLVKDLLSTLQAKVDHTRVVQLVKRLNHLPLVREYLVAVQPGDIAAVNEALHQLLIEEENFEALRTSVDTYKNFDAVALAQTLEKHAFLEFRRLGAYLYKRAGRFAQSMDISKGDQLWKDAMATAAESKDPAVAEALLRFFVSKEMAPAFAACLAVCYDLIHPDVALELAWKAKMMDFAMPYIVNVVKEYVGKVDALTSKAKEKETEAFGAPAGEAVVPGMLPPGMYPPVGAFAPPGVYMAPPAGFAPGFGPQ